MRSLPLVLALACGTAEPPKGHDPAVADVGAATSTADLADPLDGAPATVSMPLNATVPVTLAAKEIRRYLYLRTGELLALESGDVPAGDVVLVGTMDDPRVAPWLTVDVPRDGFVLKSIDDGERTVLLVVGADAPATLVGAYRLAEHLGVGFGLEGDAIPDARIPLDLTTFDEAGQPLLETRGLLPFHDFPAGPDYWDIDDHVHVIGQLPKLGLNFIGLHTYPRYSTTEEAGL